MTRDRPACVAFDIVETTISLDGLRPRLEAAGLPSGSLEQWFAGMLRDAFALDTIGQFHPFPEIARATLMARGLGADAASDVLSGFAELDAHPDAAPAMQALTSSGLRICALTNGSEGVTRQMLERNGLAPHVTEIVTIAEIERWKPAAAVYRHAAGRMGIDVSEMALFAAHPWDCAGAKAAGCMAGYVSRGGSGYPDIMPQADFVGGSLIDLADQVLTMKQP